MRTRICILTILAVTVLLGTWLLSVQAGPIRASMSPINSVATGTNITSWTSARNAYGTGYVSTDDSSPDPCDMTWTAALDNYCSLDSAYSTLSLAFYGYGDGTGDGDSNGGTFDVNVYLVEPYGGWERIASFTAAVGEMELTHNPVTGVAFNSGALDPNNSYKWVEGPFTDNLADSDVWPSLPILTGSSNGIGRLTVDPLGAKGIVVLIDNMATVTRVYPIVKER